MTGQAWYELLYAWCQLVAPSIPAIRANQNTSKPAGTYLAIEDDVSWEPVGRDDQLLSATETGTRQDYEVCAALWEVSSADGYGDSLRAMRDSISTKAVRELFAAQHVGILRASPIMSLPWTSPETQVYREKRFEIHFSIANFVVDTGGTPGTIVSVQTVNDLKVLS